MIVDNSADEELDRARRIERFAFYERAKQAFVVVQTGERRPYGNFILKKGVVRGGGDSGRYIDLLLASVLLSAQEGHSHPEIE